jgi:uncharacterized repeat protein (TIGR04138 family)
MKKSIEQIAGEDGRYCRGALQFVFEGLGKTIEKIRQDTEDLEERHISGDKLAIGLGDMAQERWGRLAKVVLNEWGLHTTRDFGEIVYLMITNEWMRAQEDDEIEDFDDVFDFETRFEKSFQFDLN